MGKIWVGFKFISSKYMYIVYFIFELLYLFFLLRIESYFFCVSLMYEMSGKLHLICMKTEGFHAKIRCNLNDISYISETQKNNFQFL